jgi:Mce-associated membrane protein
MTTRLEDPETDDLLAEPEDVREDPSEEPEEDPPAESDPPSEDTGRSWFAAFRGPRRVAVLLGVLAALLAGGGTWALLAADDLRSASSARNSALVDTGRTAEVSAAVSSALSQIFSYSYDKTEVTEEAAAAVLRGEARTTYDQLFAEVREKAPAQKLVLTTRVVSSAVQSLEGDRARVLVFLDQSATRADAGTSNAAAAQLSVTVKREGGHWVITDMVPR